MFLTGETIRRNLEYVLKISVLRSFGEIDEIISGKFLKRLKENLENNSQKLFNILLIFSCNFHDNFGATIEDIIDK